MSVSRFGRIQKAVALVPLALLSTAWTVSLANGTSAGDGPGATLDDGTAVPTEAIDDPASYTIPGRISLGVPKGGGDRVVATASTNGIPTAALAAYQRAETVINAADENCNIPWQLIAAIGRVESDHGRYNGNILSTDGVSRPGIYGIALDGTHNTAEIRDTDAGQYDQDPIYDRAVGPMQFIPSTWSVVGVDADGDGKRNPQDIDDAALAAAVYLCSGDGDLSVEADQRQAVYRYNHSRAYVDLVLRIMEAYLDGDYTSVPNYTTSGVTFTPDFDYATPGLNNPGGGKKNNGPRNGGGGGGGEQPPGEEPPTEEPPVEEPPITGGGGGVIRELEETVKDVQDGVKDIVKDTTGTVKGVLTLTQAIAQCTLDGYSALLTPAAWNACIEDYTTP
jgi:hypothetical protein